MTKYTDNLTLDINKAYITAYHKQLLIRLELIEIITDNRNVIFVINDDKIKECASKMKIEVSEVKRLVEYYKKYKLFKNIKGIPDNTIYKIGDTFLEKDDLVKRRSELWYIKKYKKY
jgi:hypothetical protein